MKMLGIEWSRSLKVGTCTLQGAMVSLNYPSHYSSTKEGEQRPGSQDYVWNCILFVNILMCPVLHLVKRLGDKSRVTNMCWCHIKARNQRLLPDRSVNKSELRFQFSPYVFNLSIACGFWPICTLSVVVFRICAYLNTVHNQQLCSLFYAFCDSTESIIWGRDTL